jgi:ORF6N domain
MPRNLPVPVRGVPVTPELVERRIYLIRGQKIMLDSDLAELYRVATKALNQAVRRNASRFPADFMFQLTQEEADILRSQFATSSLRSQFVTSNARGGRRFLPYAFTEHGVAMLSSVLKSARAVQMNIVIVRAFVKLREILASNRELAQRLDRVETRLKQHGSAIGVVVDEIKKLRAPVAISKRRIGFVAQEK